MTIEQLYILFLAQGQRITTDTRKIEKGQIFFALKGLNFDGNTYALDAIAQGARWAVVDDKALDGKDNVILVDDVLTTLQELALFHRRKLQVPIIAITGSNGKTTSKELVKEVLAKKFKVAFTKGNLNNHIGIPLTLLDIKAYEDIAIIEMGANHIGEIASYCNYVEPDFGVITNIGKAHLEGFGGIEGVLKGKTELYRHIESKQGQLFVNTDSAQLMENSQSCSRILYGSTDDALYRGNISNNQGSEFLHMTLLDDSSAVSVQTNLAGDYNASNISLAFAIGRYFDISYKDIKEAIEAYKPTNSRSQIVQADNHTIILDAYNANPSSMAVAIQNLAKHDCPTVAILGAMKELGESTAIEHEAIVRQAIDLNIGQIILVGKEFKSCSNLHSIITYFEETEAARVWYQNQTWAGQAILIKGSRGMALEKILV